MAYDATSTHRMLGVIDALDRPQMFLLETFFPDVVLFDTETIDFDKMDKARGLAPFVSPLVAGKPMRSRGFKTESYKPAYLKPKGQIDPNLPMKRRPGEDFGGTMAPGERHELAAAQIQEEHMYDIYRRKEWMAANAMVNGKVIVEGEDHPREEVDFGRAAALSRTLTGADTWGSSGVKPMRTIESFAGEIAAESGAASTVVVMDPLAKNLAFDDTEFRESLDNRRQDGGTIQLGPTVRGEDMWATYLGTFGAFEFWMYQQFYTDDGGNLAKFMPDNTILIGGSQIEGIQAHGAIKDPNANYQAIEMYPRRYIPDDPAIEHLLTQSAPLVVPQRPNASMRITVR